MGVLSGRMASKFESFILMIILLLFQPLYFLKKVDYQARLSDDYFIFVSSIA